MKERFTQRINNYITKHCTQIDVFPLIAILVNIIFVMLYINEYLALSHQVLSFTAFSICVYILGSILAYFTIPGIRRRLFAIILLLGIFLALGFFPSYAVLMTNGKKYLVLNLSSSLLLLSVVVDWVLFVLISILGMISAYILFLYTGINDVDFFYTSKKLYLLSYIVSFMFLSVSLFMRNRERIQAKKFDFMEVFGGAIAHEVKSPLAAVRMLSETLNMIISSVRAEHKDNNTVLLQLDKFDYEMLMDTINPGLQEASNSANQIVEMLLTTLRDKYIKQRDYFQISDAIKDAIKITMPLNKEDKTIICDLKEDFTVLCSRQLLKHAIHNLLKNALKHGGSKIKITISEWDRKISITDNGKGIDFDTIKKMFDPFYTKGNGSGIGLAFCKFVMDDIGGKIYCESELDIHTTFILEFPPLEGYKQPKK